MRHRVTVVLAAVATCAAAAFAGAGATASEHPNPSDPVPSRLLVTAREFGFTLSRPKVDAGPALIQLYNYGEDAHDLNLQRVGGPTISELGEVLPGATGELELRLRRGSTYRLWCSIPGHEESGMVASLRTSWKRPPRTR